MANCLNKHDQKVHLIFRNCAPWETKVSYLNGFKTKGSVYRDGFITNSNHQFFRKSIQKLGNIFLSFFLHWLFDHEIIPLLEVSAKFITTKGVQNKSIHFMQMLTSKQSLHFSRNAFINENIHKQKTKRLPLVDPLS